MSEYQYVHVTLKFEGSAFNLVTAPLKFDPNTI